MLLSLITSTDYKIKEKNWKEMKMKNNLKKLKRKTTIKISIEYKDATMDNIMRYDTICCTSNTYTKWYEKGTNK